MTNHDDAQAPTNPSKPARKKHEDSFSRAYDLAVENARQTRDEAIAAAHVEYKQAELVARRVRDEGRLAAKYATSLIPPVPAE